MHECLTGVPPYEGTPAEVMAGQLYSPLPPLPEGTPVEVQDLIARLIAKDPEQRISDAGELAALAETVRAAITPGEPMPRPTQPPVSPVDGVAVPRGVASPAGPLASGFDGPGPRDLSGPGPRDFGTPWESDSGAWEPDGEPAPWEPANTGVPGSALALRETSIDRGALALRAVGDTESPRTVYGTLVDTGPMAAEEVTRDGLAPHPLTGLRYTGDLLVTERPRRRRRAAIGVGVLVLAGGAGLTGAVASGALHPSPVANRTHTHPSLSVVQPNTTSTPRAGAGPSPAKHAKPYKPKHAKSSASASKSASGTASPAPSAPTSTTGAGAPNPQPSPSQSTPVCILGILCN